MQHRWGGGTLQGVESWFDNPADRASSHLVYAGETGRNAGRCAQLVRIVDKAWTEAAYNGIGISIESADAIWQGKDDYGFERLARITGFLCHRYGIEARWPNVGAIHRGASGVVRHADLGAIGGGHLECPTTDANLFAMFTALVRKEVRRGGFRSEWTR